MNAAFLVVCLARAALAANPDWQVSAATSALVGTETIFIYKPSTTLGGRLTPDVLASATTDFAIVKAEARPDGTWAWTLLPLDEGSRRFTARWRIDDEPVSAPDVDLKVATPPIAKDADIEDIKGPLAARRALWPWLLAAALGALGWEAWRRWKAWRGARPEAELPAPPPTSPEESAERALAELLSSDLWPTGRHAEYYLRLTEILRLYLEARWGEAATAMTTPEIARLMKDHHPDIQLAARARELLQRADLVKFARIKPQDNDGSDDAKLVLAIVAATTPRPAPEPAAEASR